MKIDTVSNLVKYLLEKEKVTQSELARRLGTTPQALSNKLSRGTFQVADLTEICNALEIRIALFVGLNKDTEIYIVGRNYSSWRDKIKLSCDNIDTEESPHDTIQIQEE